MRPSTASISEFLKNNSIPDVQSFRKGMAYVASMILKTDGPNLSHTGYDFCKDCSNIDNYNH